MRALGLDGYAMIWEVSVTRIDLRGVRHDVPSLAGSSWRQLPGRNAHNGADPALKCSSTIIVRWRELYGITRDSAQGRMLYFIGLPSAGKRALPSSYAFSCRYLAPPIGDASLR